MFEELRSPDLVDAEWKSFYVMFDRTFLQLFPAFVSNVNLLLREEERFDTKGDSALPVELRVYALIRLGINDNDRISSILHYSKSTVYAYRSRVRLKAMSPEAFEADLMRIHSI